MKLQIYKIYLNCKIFSIINFTSSSVTHGPDGRQRPCLNKFSLTPLVYAGAFLKTGCRCIGFQSGRASIPAALRFWQSFVTSISSLKMTVVSQKLLLKSEVGFLETLATLGLFIRDE